MENVCESLHEVRERCRGAQLDSCLIQRVDLSVLEFDEYTIDRVSFKNVGMAGIGFRKAFLHHCSFNSTMLRSANFTTAHLRGTNFFNSELIEGLFIGALLENVRFYDGRLANSKFAGARILNSQFSGAELTGSNFERALLMHNTFVDARMDNAQLSRASFKNAVLVDVDLHRANLYGCDFTGALLIKVDLSDANLVGCKFEGARFVSVATERADMDEEQRKALSGAGSLREALHQQDQIQEALSAHGKDTLIDTLAHLAKAYVIDGATPLKPDVGRVHVPHQLRELNFPALIETLKFHLDLPDLDKLNVVNGEVSVKLGDNEYLLNGPAPSRSPASSPQTRTPAPSSEAPVPQTTTPSTGSGLVEAPATVRESAKRDSTSSQSEKEPKEVNDRFRMLELD